MVRHQAISPHFGPRPLGRDREEIEVQRVVALFEERALATVATLGHVVRNARDDDAR
jgi:hypothetical protein